MKPICFTADGPGPVAIMVFFLVLSLISLATGVRLLRFAWRPLDPRLPLPRQQRLVFGLLTALVSAAGIWLSLYFLMVRPIC